MLTLKKFDNHFADRYRVEVNFQVNKAEIEVHFAVHSSSQVPWQMKQSFGADPRKNWGLWDWDVTEFFLQSRNNADDFEAPYLELQLAPSGAPFMLWITRPRVSYYTPLNDHQLVRFESKVGTGLWESKFYINSQLFPADGQLYGNFCACLGDSPREYFAAKFADPHKLDFHRPEAFIKL